MTTQIFRVLCMFLLCGLSATANAQVVRYDFSGTIVSAFAVNPGATNQNIFGAITSLGDSYTGVFEIDLSASQSVVIPGMVSGSAVGYDISPPLRLQLLLNGVTFENDGPFFAGVINDFSDDVMFPVLDGLSVLDGFDPSLGGTDLVGSTFLADGVPQSGVLGLSFVDLTASIFNSNALPSSFSLSDFDTTGSTGFISGVDSDLNQVGLNFTIDSVSVTAVPEPGGFCFVAATALGILRRRRRG